MQQGVGGGRGVRSGGVGHSGPAGVKPSGEYRMLNVEFLFLKRMAAYEIYNIQNTKLHIELHGNPHPTS